MSTAPTRAMRALPPMVAELGRHTAVPIEVAKSLHPAFYIDEAYVAAEREHIFSKHWFAAAHTAELANPGDVKVIDVGDTSIILTRDKSGTLHAFYNVCRHRGARVCSTSQTGCKQLVCPYHWWAYRLDGTLKATPPAVTPQEKKDVLGLQRVPGLETFAGIIFLNQTPNPPPLISALGDLPKKLARYDLDDLELHDIKDYTIKGDWKLVAENFVDFYHINSVHPELAKFSKVDNHLPYQGRGQYVGFVTAPLTDCGGPGDSHHFNPFPRLKPAESGAALFFQIFPNLSLTVYPHSVYTLLTFPSRTVGHTNERLSLLMSAGAKKQDCAADEYTEKCQGLMKFVTKVNDEDVVAIENLQVGLHHARTQEVLGEFLPKYDWPIHRFQNMVLDGLAGALLNEGLMPELPSEFEQTV